MKKQPSKQEMKSSKEEEEGFWFAFKRFLCPCLVPVQKRSPLKHPNATFQPMDNIELPSRELSTATGKKLSSSESAGKISSKEKRLKKYSKMHVQLSSKRESLLDRRSGNQQLSESFEHNTLPQRRSATHMGLQYPICSLSEKELISVGINDRHILLKVASIHLSPNPAALKKELSQSRSQRRQEIGDTNIDKYWVQRYALFERFDEGIKLDDQSWSRTPPGPVCEWIAAKCGTAKLVVDAFAGVGGSAIRLVTSNSTCLKVIANDWNGRRLEILQNNAKVYEVDKCIELSENDFIKFHRKGVDVVFIEPPMGNLDTQRYSCLSIVDFEPTLDKIISKALSLANNFILLLPAATSIDVLCSCINKCATELNKMKDTCSAKLQKIYWQGELKYVVLAVGRLVQQQVKLSHELNFIYQRLQEPEKGSFRQKKIVKFIREQYGMMFLLNLVKQCQKQLRQIKDKESFTHLDIFIKIIRERSLINKQKLEKLLLELDSPNKKQRQSQLTNTIEKDIPLESVMEEEKMNEDLPYFRGSEMTQSEESHYTYLSSLERPLMVSREPRFLEDSFGSIIIKRTINGSRQKRSVSPRSPISPISPARKNKNRVSPVNRSSTMAVKKSSLKQIKDY